MNAGLAVEPKNARYKAIVLMVLTATFWSLGGILIKWISLNPVAIAGMRSAIAALVMLAYIRKPKITWSFPQIGGAITYVGTVILFVMATKMTTAANAILLQYTAPIYAAILGAILLNEKTKWVDWCTIAFVMGGMGLFLMDGIKGGSLAGDIVGILSGVSFGSMAVFMRMQKDGSPFETVLLGNILTALIGLPFMFEKMPDTSSWIGVIILGVVQLGIPYVMYSIAIKHVTALESTLMSIIEPILNPVWVFLMIGEMPSAWAFVGGVIVLIAVTSRCVASTVKSN